MPSLKLVHKYPECFPMVRVDRGAIKFVLGGANIMCPGLNSKGGQLPDQNIEKGQPVIVNAENKKSALAIGKLLMSTDEIKTSKKGHGVELITYLGDPLWSFKF
ncbi:hypothetical protein CANCADRAFT_57186 [Tortispora caseinolytica NRRL Y-17796]|uniref:PUA domain-containing protein n=1 Tax=Tortispora caseinolytica NRRL Y-17796 TaxID=767744 RepID=A0A1E4TG68_9ASCO|nr:hypothetical protein CANCADRAFT_57186 [Tortispora caseinolytica NRRL Y-17796]